MITRIHESRASGRARGIEQESEPIPVLVEPKAEADGDRDWRRHFRQAISSIEELLDELGLEAEDLGSDLASMEKAARDFPLRVPRSYVRRMRRGDPADPLLLQVLPLAAESAEVPGFVADPLAELSASPTPGLLHKYRGRALVLPTGACAVHCRYCFRRHFPYGDHVTDWRPAVGHLAADPSIREAILSGGDPLSLSDGRLGELVAALGEIPHLERLRIHTRLPVVLPERVGPALLETLSDRGFEQVVVVVHVNHANELDTSVVGAFEALRGAGAVLLNQSVLLRRVNDEISSLCELSEALFRAGVMPYYLHVLDRVAGAAHFDVPEPRARELIRGMMGELPGYLVPKLVREVAGRVSKTPIDPL